MIAPRPDIAFDRTYWWPLPSTSPQSTWWTPLAQTCKASRISVKRGRPHGCAAVRWLELTERAGRVARLRYLFESAAGGRGVAETVGESTRASFSTANRRPGWPPRSVQVVSTTTFPCALHCPAWRLADVFDACGRPRVQEMVSEASWHLFFIRRASTPWSCFGSRGSPLSAMQSRGGLCMRDTLAPALLRCITRHPKE